jgi:hypothetical protein
MKPKGAASYSQKSTIAPYNSQGESSSHPQALFP